MQHIKTKFSHGESGPRVYARSTSGMMVWIPYDHAISADENHHVAARRLREKLGWKAGRYLTSGRRRGGFIYVPIEEDEVEL